MNISKAVHDPEVKAKLRQGIESYLLISLYLWVALGSFTIYRRLVLAEQGITYLHYGVALIEAMVIAKVVLVGRVFGFSRRFDNEPLWMPVLYKSTVFAALVMVFGVIERLVSGFVHHQGLQGGLHEIADVGAYEIAARAIMLTVAFIPFFAFSEIGRVLGRERLGAMFFARTTPSSGNA